MGKKKGKLSQTSTDFTNGAGIAAFSCRIAGVLAEKILQAGGKLLFAESVEELQQLTDEGRGKPLVILYQAPWLGLHASADEMEPWLANWSTFYSRALAHAQREPERYILVNASRLEDSAVKLVALLQQRGLTVVSAAVAEIAAELHESADKIPAALIGRSFDWILPQYWDLYEALESCAWLGGAEPDFRVNVPVPSFGELATIVYACRTQPLLASELSSLREKYELSIKREMETGRELAVAKPLLDAYRSQVFALQNYVSRLTFERGEYRRCLDVETETRKAQQARLQMIEERTIREKAEHRPALLAMQAEREKLEAAHTVERQLATEALCEKSAEAQDLLERLQSAHEELELNFFSSREFANQTEATIERLEKEKKDLAGQAEDLRKKLAQSRKERERVAEELTAELTSEKQAYAELERRFDEIEKRLAQASDEAKQLAQASAARAEALGKKLIQSKKERDRIAADLTAELTSAQKAGAELERRLKDAEKRLAAAMMEAGQLANEKATLASQLVTEQMAFQEDRKRLLAEATTLRGNHAQVSCKLKSLTEELGKAQDVASTLQTEIGPLRAAASLAGEQQKKIEQLRRKLKAAESEGEGMLLQLHHVQQELERYFFMYKDARSALKASAEGFLRGQRVISELMKVREA